MKFAHCRHFAFGIIAFSNNWNATNPSQVTQEAFSPQTQNSAQKACLTLTVRNVVHLQFNPPYAGEWSPLLIFSSSVNASVFWLRAASPRRRSSGDDGACPAPFPVHSSVPRSRSRARAFSPIADSRPIHARCCGNALLGPPGDGAARPDERFQGAEPLLQHARL